MNGDTTRKSRQNEPIKKHGHGQPGQLQHLWKEQVAKLRPGQTLALAEAWG